MPQAAEMKPVNRKPRKQPLQVTDPNPARSKSAPRLPPANTKATRKRILLVEDDAVVRASLNDLLLGEGYEVIPANDGQRAVDLATGMAPDIVLLDLTLPVKNGWDTFEQLTREHPLLPIIIVTGRTNQLFTAAGAGAGALLEKPLDIPSLLQTIQRLLAEPPAVQIARLAGEETEFHYSAARK